MRCFSTLLPCSFYQRGKAKAANGDSLIYIVVTSAFKHTHMGKFNWTYRTMISDSRKLLDLATIKEK